MSEMAMLRQLRASAVSELVTTRALSINTAPFMSRLSWKWRERSAG